MSNQRQNAINLGLLGPSCKSIESKTSYSVTFRNLMENDASIYWIDFQGRPVFYGFIKKSKAAGVGFLIETFLTHPWIAVYRRNRTFAAINFNRVFKPITGDDFINELKKTDRLRAIPQYDEPTDHPSFDGLTRSESGIHINAFITEIVLSLEVSCYLRICRMMQKEDIRLLDIPKNIKDRILDVYDTWLLAT